MTCIMITFWDILKNTRCRSTPKDYNPRDLRQNLEPVVVIVIFKFGSIYLIQNTGLIRMRSEYLTCILT